VTPRYPSATRPELAIENAGNKTVRLTTRSNPNLVIDFFEADSLGGPWLYASTTPYVPGSRKFFRAAVNLNWVRVNQYFMVSTALMAVRVADSAITTEFTTRNGFQLKMVRPDWAYGISIFSVVDGPSTGDLVGDYQRLNDDLLADERTLFVSSASGGSCILGQTDILRLNRGTVTQEQMAQFNLELVSDEPNIVVARWTKAKSMSLEAFEGLLNSAGIAGGFTSIGCAD